MNYGCITCEGIVYGATSADRVDDFDRIIGRETVRRAGHGMITLDGGRHRLRDHRSSLTRDLNTANPNGQRIMAREKGRQHERIRKAWNRLTL